jgi:hypothetical protein
MRRSELSAAQQAFALHARFPDAKGTLKAGRLLWSVCLQPTPISRTYRIQIDYGPRGQPRVRVLDQLRMRAGESLPHVYSDDTLCLHLVEEWSSRMFIADTTVPWIAEWLVNYEIWLATGEWYGGGEWPPRRIDAEQADSPKAKEPPRAAG